MGPKFELKNLSEEQKEKEIIRLREEVHVLQEIIKYQKQHLEETIEHRSIEKYRETLQKNREVADTTPR